ncbi:hypothetical protein F511_28705 [Dorcoceras hygrometricum]|uniref:Dystroglycan-like n=1 Tax=Dorcoceras hygrometricum TaxID=472368 RepID=A0A2Z7BZ01_9LAMI|nr:hypothetical protein F511_28705 [Dorcoceras hygrometricum]
MASSLISNSRHIDFDSVFDMDDAGLAQVFETLIAAGLRNFLGCPAVFYEEALLEFFTNGSVREDGMVVSTIRGTTVEISESLFATTFDLPTEGLTDLSDVPKDNIFDARRLFSASKEQVSVSCFKKEMKIEYRLLHDILAKTIFVKAGYFDAVTRDRFLLMTAITLDLKVNWGSLLFSVLKGMKKRTTKGKAVVIAQEAVPPKIDDATTDAPVEQLSVPKRKSQKRKRKLVLEDAIEVDEPVPAFVEQPAVVPVVEVEQLSVPKRKSQKRKRKLVLEDAIEVDEPVPAFVEQPAVVPVVEGTTEDPEAVIEQILHQLDTVGATDGGEHPAPTTKESFPWFDLPVFLARREAEGFVGSSSDTDEELIADQPTVHLFPDAGPYTLQCISSFYSCSNRHSNQVWTRDEFREVDAYKASLPQIDASDKGKGILVEDDVQGHPAREIFSLICADIVFLIALWEKVIEGVSIFVSSFSLCKLATLQSEDIFAKEGQVLSWAETDSSFVAIQRRRLIIAKYRELLLRKFIEARRKNFVSGTPTSAIDLKVLKLLGAAHLFALKVLLRHMREHQLEWTQPSSSSLFECPVIDRGFFIPPNHHSITSKCWIRAKIMVDGSWLILEGVDYWRPITTPVSSRHWEALPQRPYLDDLAPLCVFVEPVQDIDSRTSLSRAIIIFWAEICMEAVQFSLLGSLRPVGSVNFCRELVVRGSVVEVIETLPIRFRRIIKQGINCNSFVDSVVQLVSAEIQEVDVQGIDEVDLVSSEDSTVYRSPSPILQETDSFDSPVHLNGDDIPLEDNVNVQTTFPATTADLSPLLDDLKTSLSQRMDNAHSDILSRLHTIERGLQNTLGHQNDYFRSLIHSARQEGQNQDDLQILRLNELKKTVMAQSVTADTDSLAIRNRFNALDAKILLLYGQVAAIRSEQLEFQEKMAADFLSLSTQIGDLVDYIRGGDAKKGEGSSSRRPLPAPVNQGESSGNVIRTTEIISPTDIDAAQRGIMERKMRADRERDRERRERRLRRNGSYKRRRGYYLG